MRKGIAFILALTAIVLLAPAASGQEDLAQHMICPYCGMDRSQCSFSRAVVAFSDGSRVGTCSIHCAVKCIALLSDKSPVAIKVADYDTTDLIDAETAVWVTGSSRQGVMTARARWAFATRQGADAFIRQYGGEVSTFAMPAVTLR